MTDHLWIFSQETDSGIPQGNRMFVDVFDTCRICRATSVRRNGGAGARCLADTALSKLGRGFLCPATCEETAVLLVHLE